MYRNASQNLKVKNQWFYTIEIPLWKLNVHIYNQICPKCSNEILSFNVRNFIESESLSEIKLYYWDYP